MDVRGGQVVDLHRVKKEKKAVEPNGQVQSNCMNEFAAIHSNSAESDGNITTVH